jgi:20S proteasome subunit beta 3
MTLSFVWFVPTTILLILFKCNFNLAQQQQQDPSTMNGGSCLAMAGKDCVALAIDKRFGSGSSLININAQPDNAKILVLSQHSGLEGDVISLQQDLRNIVATKYNYNYYQQQHSNGSSGSRMSGTFLSPRSMASLTSHVLYNRRNAPYYVEPIIVGLERRRRRQPQQQQQQRVATDDSNDDNESRNPIVDESIINTVSRTAAAKSSCSDTITAAQEQYHRYRYRPYLCSMDMIGAKSTSRAFCCSGAAAQSLYGTAEALWRPNLDEEQLVRTCARAFTTALERDCLSGYGAVVYLVSPSKGIVAYDISSRND